MRAMQWQESRRRERDTDAQHQQVENVASAAVLKSCGFKETRTFMLEWPASKGGGMREIHEWEWSAEAGDDTEV